MKRIVNLLLVMVLIGGCAVDKTPVQEGADTEPKNEVAEVKELPVKPDSQSTLMSESPIDATNIDEYLFRDDCLYIDTRSPNQLLEEGMIAGFFNIPFYDFLVSYQFKENVLFSMALVRDGNGEMVANLGEVGSFSPNYEESVELIEDLFPKDKNIIFMSTAGVEATYLMNLLIQLGYDGSKLYNAGPFTNGMGDIVAYKDYKGAQYYYPGTNVYTVNVVPNWGELTPIVSE